MIKYVTIPIKNHPFYDMSISLEGTSYILEFSYNRRTKLYSMSIYDPQKNPLVLGEAVVPNHPIMFDYVIEGLTGTFLLTEKEEVKSEPYLQYPDKVADYYDMIYLYNSEE